MTDQTQDPPPKRRAQRNAAAKFIIGLLFLMVAALGAMFILFPDSLDSITAWTNRSDTVARHQPSANSGEEPLDTQHSSLPGDAPAPVTADGSASPADSASRPEEPIAMPSDQNGNEAGDLSETSGATRQSQCTQLADGVEDFFDVLDTRPYLQAFRLDEKSSIYFPQLIQKLVDNPPVVTGETDDLFTILQNTAHFFRIIGKHNIIVLKGILDRERDTFEQVLADFYQLTNYPDCLQQRFQLDINNDPLYQYAGFFLNTMGGRLYLFRRDSMSRMVVNYYAILIIDQANREGRNKYGIDIGPAIDSLIDDIQGSNIDLRMRDRYLKTLYELEEKYQ